MQHLVPLFHLGIDAVAVYIPIFDVPLWETPAPGRSCCSRPQELLHYTSISPTMNHFDKKQQSFAFSRLPMGFRKLLVYGKNFMPFRTVGAEENLLAVS